MKKQALYTESTSSGKRSFYFDIKEAKNGTNYMAITSISKRDETINDRHQVLIFEGEMDRFAGAFMRSLINFDRKVGRG